METRIVFSITDGTPLSLALQGAAQTANAYFKAQHSVEYWAEELLTKGITAELNYIRSDKERRAKENFSREMAKLMPPTDATNIQAMAGYATQVAKLRQKYGIGGTQVAL